MGKISQHRSVLAPLNANDKGVGLITQSGASGPNSRPSIAPTPEPSGLPSNSRPNSPSSLLQEFQGICARHDEYVQRELEGIRDSIERTGEAFELGVQELRNEIQPRIVEGGQVVDQTVATVRKAERSQYGETPPQNSATTISVHDSDEEQEGNEADNEDDDDEEDDDGGGDEGNQADNVDNVDNDDDEEDDDGEDTNDESANSTSTPFLSHTTTRRKTEDSSSDDDRSLLKSPPITPNDQEWSPSLSASASRDGEDAYYDDLTSSVDSGSPTEENTKHAKNSPRSELTALKKAKGLFNEDQDCFEKRSEFGEASRQMGALCHDHMDVFSPAPRTFTEEPTQSVSVLIGQGYMLSRYYQTKKSTNNENDYMSRPDYMKQTKNDERKSRNLARDRKSDQEPRLHNNVDQETRLHSNAVNNHESFNKFNACLKRLNEATTDSEEIDKHLIIGKSTTRKACKAKAEDITEQKVDVSLSLAPFRLGSIKGYRGRKPTGAPGSVQLFEEMITKYKAIGEPLKGLSLEKLEVTRGITFEAMTQEFKTKSKEDERTQVYVGPKDCSYCYHFRELIWKSDTKCMADHENLDSLLYVHVVLLQNELGKKVYYNHFVKVLEHGLVQSHDRTRLYLFIKVEKELCTWGDMLAGKGPKGWNDDMHMGDGLKQICLLLYVTQVFGFLTHGDINPNNILIFEDTDQNMQEVTWADKNKQDKKKQNENEKEAIFTTLELEAGTIVARWLKESKESPSSSRSSAPRFIVKFTHMDTALIAPYGKLLQAGDFTTPSFAPPEVLMGNKNTAIHENIDISSCAMTLVVSLLKKDLPSSFHAKHNRKCPRWFKKNITLKECAIFQHDNGCKLDEDEYCCLIYFYVVFTYGREDEATLRPVYWDALHRTFPSVSKDFKPPKSASDIEQFEADINKYSLAKGTELVKVRTSKIFKSEEACIEGLANVLFPEPEKRWLAEQFVKVFK